LEDHVSDSQTQNQIEAVAIWPSFIEKMGSQDTVTTIKCKSKHCGKEYKVRVCEYRNVFTARRHKLYSVIEKRAIMGNLSVIPINVEQWYEERQKVVEKYDSLDSEISNVETEEEEAEILKQMEFISGVQKSQLESIKGIIQQMVEPVTISHCDTCRKAKRVENELREETRHMSREDAVQYRKKYKLKGYYDNINALKAIT